MIHQCEECGKRGVNLRRCGRCKSVWYCGKECQRRNWELHRSSCQPHEIADEVEKQDPKFAEWIRTKNRNVAIVTDPTAKIEYGKLPKRAHDPQHREQEGPQEPAPAKAEVPFGERQESAYSAALTVLPGFGIDEGSYKWSQTTSDVMVVAKLREGTAPGDLDVSFGAESLRVRYSSGEEILSGTLAKAIKVDESLWEYDRKSCVLTITLLKMWRRGNYKKGETSAETWWKSLFTDSAQLQEKYPPTDYYSTNSF